MSAIENGGTAFPVADTVMPNGQVQFGSCGMTLRDYFAAKAMAGILSNPELHSIAVQAMKEAGCETKSTCAVTAGAYAYADAMLAERAKEKQP